MQMDEQEKIEFEDFEEIIEALNETIMHDKGSKPFLKLEKDCIDFCDSLNFSAYLSSLLSRYRYFYDNDMLDDEKMFFVKQKEIKKEIKLSKYEQTQAFDFWNKIGVITKKRKGVPAKNYYKINMIEYYKNVYPELYSNRVKNLTSRSQKISLLDVKKFDNYINKNNNNKNNNISFKDLSLKENAFPSGKAKSQNFIKEEKILDDEDQKADIQFIKKAEDKFYDQSNENNQDFIKEELSDEDQIIIGIFDSCNSYGKPFTNHKKTNKNGEETKIYRKSFKIIRDLLKTESPELLIGSRRNFYNFLKSGFYKETSIDPQFTSWNPSLVNFFKPDKITKRAYKNAGFPIKSLYHEFKPGMHPDIKFARFIQDEYPEITNILKESLFRVNGFTAKDENLLRNAAVKLGKMQELLTKGRQWCYGMSLDSTGLASKLIEFVKGHDWYGGKISPGILASDALICNDFYNHLESEGFIKGSEEKTKKFVYDIYSDEN
jgi:hypothetical protein